MSSANSEIIGLERAGSALARAGGTSPSGNGWITPATIAPDLAREWLLAHAPREVDKALQTSLQSQLDVEVSPRVEGRYPPNAPAYTLAVGCDVGGRIANLPNAIAKVEAAMTPPTKTQAEDWLIMLQAATAGGRRSEVAVEVAFDLYSGALMRYPADVARAACEKIACTPRDATSWFPTLAEIIGACDRLVSARQAMLAGLKAFYAKQQGIEHKPKAVEPLDQRREMAAKIRAAMGIRASA